MSVSRPITSYSCLAFDCFGTLINWETALYRQLLPLIRRLPTSHPLYNDRSATLKALLKHEGRILVSRPTELYNKVLADAYGDLAAELGLEASDAEKTQFGASIGDWAAFSDTLDALQRLKKHFKLVILSNVDRESFQGTLRGPLGGVVFDAVYTAQDIGSYKPDLRNFQYLIDHCREDLGVEKESIIHTAYSLYHDLVPAKEIGLASAYIERSGEIDTVMGGKLRDFEGKVNFDWHFMTLGDMADAVDAAHDSKE
ncbi:hypothetical protein DL764_006996 [Monosporascus ibericus]|uniref:Haloacid dehalogenase, type II n=1 Tax=Monosporascus ibericus TaxID=155417 RepID=A0A4Q4T591_9PEZI|nr:hypothetical protein DL764_006996 [Monosporascus ibericus]